MKEQKYISLVLKRGNYESFNVGAVVELLQQLADSNREFTRTMAELDLLVSAYKGCIKPFRYYAKRWKWSEGKSRNLFIKLQLLRKPKSWQTRHELHTQYLTLPTTQSQHNNSIKTVHNSQDSTHHNTATAQPQHGQQHGIISLKEHRVLINDTSPSLEEILEYCASMSYPQEVGINAFDHYEAVGWLTGNGLPILNWKAMVRKWYNNSQKKYKGNPNGFTKHKQPISTGTRRQDISNEEFIQRTNAARQLLDTRVAYRTPSKDSSNS